MKSHCPHQSRPPPRLLSVSMDLPVLDTSYKGNHTTCGLWSLSAFAGVMLSRFIHTVACVRALFLFRAEYCSSEWVDHILFDRSSVDGHLGCFYFLALVNSVVNIRVPDFMWVCFRFCWVDT